MKMKKKISILCSISLAVITAIAPVDNTKFFSTKKVDKSSLVSKEKKKVVEEKMPKNKKSTETVEENNGETEEFVEEKMPSSNETEDKNMEKNNYSRAENTATNDIAQNNAVNSVPTPAQVQQRRPQTEWEKLGITEYEYNNTPANSSDEINFKNIAECQSEANRINQRGRAEKKNFVANYGYTPGAYVDVAGCWVKIWVDGVKYKYSQFVSAGF